MLLSHRFGSGVLLAAVSSHLAVAQSFSADAVRVVPWSPVAPAALTRAALTDLDSDGLQDLVGLDGSVLTVALGVGYHRSFRPSVPDPVSDFAVLGSTLFTVGGALQSWAYDPAGVAPFTGTSIEPATGSRWLGARRLLPIDLSIGARGFAGVDAAGTSVLLRQGVQSGGTTFVMTLPATIIDLEVIDDGTAVPTVIAVTATALYRVRPNDVTLIAPFSAVADEARLVTFRQSVGFERVAALMKFAGHPHQQLFLYDLVLGFELPYEFPGLTLRGLAAADHDLDGDDDLVSLQDTVATGELHAFSLRNCLGEPGVTITFPSSGHAFVATGAGGSNGGSSVAIVMGDVTNDGDADLVLPAAHATELRVLENQTIAHEELRLTLLTNQGAAGSLLYDNLTGTLSGGLDVLNVFPGTTHVEVRLWRTNDPIYDSQGALLPLELDASVIATVDTVALGDGSITIELVPVAPTPGAMALVMELTPLVLDAAGVELGRGPLQAFAAALDLELYGDFGTLYGAPEESPVPIEELSLLTTNGRTEIGGITPVEEPPDFEDEDELPPNPGGDDDP